MNVPVLRRTKADWLAVGAITAIAAVALGFSVATSDISHASLQRENTPGAEHQASYLEAAPEALTEAFRLPNESVAGQFRPIASRGLVMSNDDHTVTATNPDGSTAWTYTRDNVEICSMGTAWDRVVVTYRNGRGCGDVVSIDAATGMYADTRSANNSDTVHAIYSNDRIGTVSSDRVDLWRSDLVRTVEYGDVEAKQEPDLQPNESCTINSALTRTELLVVSETCPSAQGTNFLRFQNTTRKIRVSLKSPRMYPSPVMEFVWLQSANPLPLCTCRVRRQPSFPMTTTAMRPPARMLRLRRQSMTPLPPSRRPLPICRTT